MQTCKRALELRTAIAAQKQAGRTIAFVPTMGNLHDGHLDLVRRANEIADKAVVSIFVNALQFGENEDLADYPRTLEDDKRRLFAENTAYLFVPTEEEMYPHGQQDHTRVTVQGISQGLCGAARPTHFEGVATIVCTLLNIVQPDIAIFGQKDFQQVAVIRRMVTDLCIPVDIEAVPTAREEDGLAMSSRNRYLSEKERKIAPFLHNTLLELKNKLLYNKDNFSHSLSEASSALESMGFRPDYVEVRDAQSLQALRDDSKEAVILAAASLGNTRLLDNVTVVLNPK